MMKKNNDNNTKYDLTEEEYEKCLKMAEIAIFMNAKKAEKPVSIFVVSQPGAGKTGLRSYIESEQHESNNFVEFDPDVIAIYHKYYNEILNEFPKESYQILQRFVSVALDTYLRNKAVQLRNNIIQEGTFGSTDGYIKVLDFQKNGGKAKLGPKKENKGKKEIIVDGGYNIDINILAVHRYESLLSSYEREQYFIESDLPPRAVTKENHDRAYKNMLNTIKIVEDNQLFNKMRVFKRGYIESKPELVYITGDNKYRNTVEAVLDQREKSKQELFKNPEKYIERIEELKKRVKKNQKSNQIQLEKIEDLKQEFLNELEKSKENEKS